MVNNGLHLEGFLPTVNGDNVVAYVSSKNYKANFSENDFQSVSEWYERDPKQNDLGLIQMFAHMANVQAPMYLGALTNKSVIEVDGPRGTFSYELPVATDNCMMTVEDTSMRFPYAGLDGTTFEQVFNSPITNGDVLSCDVTNSYAVFVSNDYPVYREGNNYRATLKTVGLGRSDYYPKDKLRAGIKYWKIGHGMGEYSTQYSKISGETQTGYQRAEFHLGNHRGVEAAITYYGNRKISGASVNTQDFMDKALRKMRDMSRRVGSDQDLDLAIVGQMNPATGDINRGTARLASTIELMCYLELFRLENTQIMFQPGGLIEDNNGPILLNEGIYHQLRRGYTVQYGRPGGITKEHISAVASYVFQGSGMSPLERRIKFKCGWKSYVNMMLLFRPDFYAQIANLNPLLGEMALIKNPVSGTNTNLSLGPVVVTSLWLPDIGQVEIEHDSSLDSVMMVDKSALIDGIWPLSSFSMIIEDVTDPAYSNAFASRPGTVKYIGNQDSNIYIVRPEGPYFYGGTHTGRWSSRKSTDIAASIQYMQESYFCHSISAGWVRDTSKFVLVELDPRTVA